MRSYLFRRLALLTGLTFFCGCHSAPAPVVQSPAPAVSAVKDTRPAIVCFGDSLTAGYGADPGETYPDYLQQDLDAAGYSYHVANDGVSGDTTKDGLLRLPRILAAKPEVVILELGGNDGLRGLPVLQTQKNMDEILAALTAAKIHVVLGGISLPANYGAEYIHSFDRIYPALAKKYRVPLLPMLLTGVYGVPGSMQEDNIHATAQGNQQVAKNFLPYLTPLLHK